MYSRPYESTIRFLERKFAARPELVSRPTSRRSGPAGTSARRPRTSPSATRSSRPRCRRAPTATSPATRRCRWASWPPGCAPGCRSSSARTRSPRPRTSCTSCQQAQAVRHHHDAGRGRDRRGRRRARRLVRRLAGHHHDLRPGCGAQERDDLPGRRARAAAGDRRRAAGRPVDRHADQDRAGRPQHGAVRAARRGAGRGGRAAVTVRLLLRGARSGPDRADLPHAGDPALRQLRRQRLRAVAAAGGRLAARPAASSSRPSPTARTARSCRTCATR